MGIVELRDSLQDAGEIILMENGDLLIMLDNCQENWLHAILKEKEIKDPRISLTFRNVISNE